MQKDVKRTAAGGGGGGRGTRETRISEPSTATIWYGPDAVLIRVNILLSTLANGEFVAELGSGQLAGFLNIPEDPQTQSPPQRKKRIKQKTHVHGMSTAG